MGNGDHRCEWREKAEGLQAELEAAPRTIAAQARTIQAQGESLSKVSRQFDSVQATVEKLQRHVIEKSSGKTTPPAAGT
jgi:transposase